MGGGESWCNLKEVCDIRVGGHLNAWRDLFEIYCLFVTLKSIFIIIYNTQLTI
jgi:hypothetical protein